jgi:hypothetical protein
MHTSILSPAHHAVISTHSSTPCHHYYSVLHTMPQSILSPPQHATLGTQHRQPSYHQSTLSMYGTTAAANLITCQKKQDCDLHPGRRGQYCSDCKDSNANAIFLKPTQPYSSAHPPQALLKPCPAALCILGVAAACAGLQCAPQLCKRC